MKTYHVIVIDSTLHANECWVGAGTKIDAEQCAKMLYAGTEFQHVVEIKEV